MRKPGWVLEGWILGGLLLAGSVARCQEDWRRVEKLKPGTTVDVWTGSGEENREYMRCRLVSVDAGSLSCEGDARTVLPVKTIESVAVWKEGRPSVVRAVLFGVLGAGMGAAVTDGSPDVPLAVLGGIAGLGYGLATSHAHGRMVAVYRRPWPGRGGAS